MKIKSVIPPLIIIAVLCVIATPIYFGAKKISASQAQCEAKGGTQVRTYDGLACIDAKPR